METGVALPFPSTELKFCLFLPRAPAYLDGFGCLLFGLKLHEGEALGVSGRLVVGYADVNNVAAFPEHPFNPAVVDVFGKQLLR